MSKFSFNLDKNKILEENEIIYIDIFKNQGMSREEKHTLFLS